jgi:hypothetical protein
LPADSASPETSIILLYLHQPNANGITMHEQDRSTQIEQFVKSGGVTIEGAFSCDTAEARRVETIERIGIDESNPDTWEGKEGCRSGLK